jgi:hypothetical protein
MRWFRLHTRPTSCLALFALALQLILSLGHAHGDKGRFSAAAAQGLAFTNIKSGTAGAPAAPAQQDNEGFCAICASINLAGSLVLPSPPTQALPRTIDRAWVSPAPARIAPAAERLLFQARAPPAPDCGDALERRHAAA